MSNSQIITSDDVYRFVERLKVQSEKGGLQELATQLDDALHLGSSGLEILGAIRQAVIENRIAIEQMLGPSRKDEAEQVIAFVDRAYGR